MTQRLLDEPKRLELMSKLALAPQAPQDSRYNRYRETLGRLNFKLRSGADECEVLNTLKSAIDAYSVTVETESRSTVSLVTLQEGVAALEALQVEVLERWTQASRLKDAIDELYIPLSRARQELPHTASGSNNSAKLYGAMKTADELTRLGWPPLEAVEELIDLVNEVIESPDCSSVDLALAVNRVEAELVRETIAQAVS